jgi:MFS family permease
MLQLAFGVSAGSMAITVIFRIGKAEETTPRMTWNDLFWCRYSDYMMYVPMSLLAVKLVDNFGLKGCLITGSLIMIVGCLSKIMICFGYSIWWWYYGHIICIAANSYIKTPLTKLCANWFGDKERTFATAISIVSVPLGIIIAKLMINFSFDKQD